MRSRRNVTPDWVFSGPVLICEVSRAQTNRNSKNPCDYRAVYFFEFSLVERGGPIRSLGWPRMLRPYSPVVEAGVSVQFGKGGPLSSARATDIRRNVYHRYKRVYR